MKQLITISLLLMSFGAFAQSNGDFKSKQSGDWNSTSTWEVFNAGTLGWDPATGLPTSSNSVFIEDGDSVYLTANAFCKNLNLNGDLGSGDTARLNTQTFTLEVTGKLRMYSGAAPGSSATPANYNSKFLIQTPGGKIKVVGTTRDLVILSDWGVPANFNGWTLEIALNSAADTVVLKTNLRAGNITVTSGTVHITNTYSFRLDSGGTNTGNLTIKAGANLVLDGGVLIRQLNQTFNSFTLDTGANLVVAAGVAQVLAQTVKLGGTVITTSGNLLTNSGISGAAAVNIFNNLSLRASTTLASGITVNGILSLTADNQLNLNSNLLNYGANALVAYEGTTAQATSNVEYPSSNGPSGFILNNAAGLTLHASRTVTNWVKMVSGALSVGANVLSYGANASLEYAGTAMQTATNNEFPKSGGPAHLVINNALHVQLNDTHALAGNLVFMAGKLMTSNTAPLTLGASSVIMGANSSSYVDGPLELTLASASQTAKMFAIGKGSTYRPVILNITQNAATSTTYKAELMNAAPPARTVPASLDSVSSIRYWSISKGTGATITSASIILNYDAGDFVPDSTKLRVVRDNGTDWVDLGGSANGNNTGTILSDSNFTSLGAFTFGYALPTSLYPYPIISIDSLQYVSAQKLAAGNTRPDYQLPVAKDTVYGDTVQVEGVVTFDPRYYGLSVNRRATFIQNASGGGWSGIEIMCDPATVSGWSGGLATYKTATQFNQNSVKGLKVRYVGVLKNFNGSGPATSGETQLNILPYPAEIVNLTPVPVTPTVVNVDDLMKNNGSGTMVAQPATGEQYEGVYVQLNNVTVVDRAASGANRWLWSLQDANGNKISVYDLSAYFRNDNLEDTVGPPAIPGTPYFAPPQIGVTFSYVRGVITETYATATGTQQYVISPLVPADLGPVLGVAPSITRLPRNPVVATSSSAVTINARITDDTTVSSAALYYAVGMSTTTFTQVAMTLASGTVTDGIWSANIPAQVNGSIVKYFVKATDNSGKSSFSPDSLATNSAYIVTDGGVTTITQLQYSPLTSGNSIWNGDTLTGISVKGIVTSTTKSDDLGLVTIQSGSAPNSAIFIQPAVGDGIDQWNRGDSIVISSCVVRENFNITTLYNAGGSNHTVAATGKTLPSFITTLPLDSVRLKVVAYTEPYEAMLVEFDSVYTVNLNADAPSNFGEWSFNKDSSATNGLRADDQSNDIPANFNTDSLQLKRFHQYMKGVLYFSFSNWKLLPRNRDDIGGFKTNYGPNSVKGILADAEITLFPNPANTFIQIRLVNPSFATNQSDFKITLSDITGKTLKTVNMEGGVNTITQQIDISDFGAGIYFCNISTDGASNTVKLVVVR